MSDILRHIYNACDPMEPATSEYYFDCSVARGDSAVTQKFQRQLALAKDHLSFLFSGHFGCGKSSELRQLKHALSNPAPSDPCCFPVLIPMLEYLDEHDVELTDILLAVVAGLADTLRSEAKIDIKDSYIIRRLHDIQELALTDVGPKDSEISLWKLRVKFQLLRIDPTTRKKVREALMPHLLTLLQEVNSIFERARLALKKLRREPGKPSYQDIVLILDNLERIQRFRGKSEGLESHQELYLQCAPQLTGLKAHVIYTTPLRLARFYGPQLQLSYGVAPVVLPMIKVIERGSDRPYQPGMDCLRDLLRKRLNGLTLDQVFMSDALDFLLKYSGGHVRTLMIFVQEACAQVRDIPISLTAAHRAVEPTVALYDRSISERFWEKLARLERSRDQKIPGNDTDYLEMLESLSILEYINGGRSGNPFALTPWYAVNPIVRELQQFKEAVSALSQVSPP